MRCFSLVCACACSGNINILSNFAVPLLNNLEGDKPVYTGAILGRRDSARNNSFHFNATY